MKFILVATDFSPAADQALKVAGSLAAGAGCAIALLHVKNKQTASLLEKRGKGEDQLEEYLTALSQHTAAEYGVECAYRLGEGSIFTQINNFAADPDCLICLMGTHGARGLRQSLFGADMLKIARQSPVPVWAIPEGMEWKGSLRKIIFPFGGHSNFEPKTKAAGWVAKTLGATICLYTIDRPQMEISRQTRENIEKAREYFTEQGIDHELVHDQFGEFSIGYAGQTLAYAKETGAEAIAVMSTPSEEHWFISAADKEKLIDNKEGISILLTAEL